MAASAAAPPAASRSAGVWKTAMSMVTSAPVSLGRASSSNDASGSSQPAGVQACVTRRFAHSRRGNRSTGGSGPEMPQLCDRLSRSRLASAPSSPGMGPVRSFPSSDSHTRSTRLPSSPGIGPVNAFRPRFSPHSRVRFPSHDGTGPVSSLSQRDSRSRPIRPSTSPRIGPVNALEPRSSVRRAARFPSPDGIGPLRPLSSRSSSVTRPAESVVAPCQSPSGADVFQPARLVQPGRRSSRGTPRAPRALSAGRPPRRR